MANFRLNIRTNNLFGSPIAHTASIAIFNHLEHQQRKTHIIALSNFAHHIANTTHKSIVQQIAVSCRDSHSREAGSSISCSSGSLL